MHQTWKVSPAAGRLHPTLLAACLTFGCGHTEPFSNPPYGSDSPFDPTPPQRLTYNTAADRGAAWLADGSGIVYSAQQTDRGDGDVCLALLPPGGGSQRGLWCDVPEDESQRDAVESAAPAADGRLAFLSATGTITGINPVREGIALAPSLDPRGARMVRSFPVTPAGGVPEETAGHLRWLDGTRLVYVGQRFRTRQVCPLCVVDTLRIGLQVSVLETAAPGSVPTALPGTANATGAATGPDPDLVYYTLGGDSRVYRQALSTGVVEVAHDFGAAGIARDIGLAGNRLVAVVGGRVAFVTDPQLGAVQWDSGGEVHVVDLAGGDDVRLDPGARLFRRPALSPDGAVVVAEGFPLVITRIETVPPIIDTTVAKTGDLFRVGAP